MRNIVARGIAAVAFSVFAGHCSAVSTAIVAASVQDAKAVTSTAVAGTWNMTLMSHQVALVLEQDGAKVTGTLMMPGTDFTVVGNFADGVLMLTATAPPPANEPSHAGTVLTITGKFQEDGTLAGEVSRPNSRSPWTAERLRERKK